MPPAGMPRPDPTTYESMAAWLEHELDRDASRHTPPPGLHRLNRTEYTNVVRDLLDLADRPGEYLPSDDSTAGFDNIAGALGYFVDARRGVCHGGPEDRPAGAGRPEEPTLVVYRILAKIRQQDYHIEGFPLGTRGGLLVVALVSVRR